MTDHYVRTKRVVRSWEETRNVGRVVRFKGTPGQGWVWGKT